MHVRKFSPTFALAGLIAGLGALSAALGQTPPTAAKVDTAPLELTSPDRFLVPAVLEPTRRVTLVAMADGIVRSQLAKAGATVREGQEIAQLDRAEATARLRIAQAVVKELQAAHEEMKSTAGQSKSSVTQAEARLDAARARADLAQLDLDRCTLRAPFGGKVVATPVSDGQYVDKGGLVAELADVSSVRVLIPIGRAGATVGASVTLTVEGQSITGKIQALLPLPESMAGLHELSTPFTAAWVVLPNASGALEPGQRVLSPDLPTMPITTIPTHALLKPEEKGGPPSLQVIRDEYVTNVKVKVLGNPGPDRVQVSGALRPNDSLIVSTSVPLLAGTLIRFNGNPSSRIEATTSNPAIGGEPASVTPPRGAAGADTRGTLSKTKGTAKPIHQPPASNQPKSGGDAKSVPF